MVGPICVFSQSNKHSTWVHLDCVWSPWFCPFYIRTFFSGISKRMILNLLSQTIIISIDHIVSVIFWSFFLYFKKVVAFLLFVIYCYDMASALWLLFTFRGYIEAIREIEKQLHTVADSQRFDDIVVACGRSVILYNITIFCRPCVASVVRISYSCSMCHVFQNRIQARIGI